MHDKMPFFITMLERDNSAEGNGSDQWCRCNKRNRLGLMATQYIRTTAHKYKTVQH